MLITIVGLQLALVQSEPAEPVISTTVSGSYSSALAGPVEQYSTCITEKTNAAMAGGVSLGHQIRLIYGQAKLDCEEVRRMSSIAGDAILRRQGWSNKSARLAAVEDALLTVDEHGEAFAAMADRINTPEAIAARRKSNSAQNK